MNLVQPISKYSLKDQTLSSDKDLSKDISLDNPYLLGLPSDTKIFVYSHGNTGNIYSCNKWARHIVSNTGYTVLTYDYPGYGFMTGTPSEKSCTHNLSIAVDFCISIGIIKPHIILLGRSLGTGIVINYVHQTHWESPIILISPFRSILDVIMDKTWRWSRTIIRTLINFFRLIQGNEYDNVTKVPSITSKCLIYAGSNDTTIPSSHSNHIYRLLHNPMSQYIEIKGADHKDLAWNIDVSEWIRI